MSNNKQQYSVIREQGEFMEPVKLTDEENDVITASENSKEEEKDN